MCDIWLVDLSPGLNKDFSAWHLESFATFCLVPWFAVILYNFFFIFLYFLSFSGIFAEISFISWEKRPGRCQDVYHLARGSRCGREQVLLMLASSTHVLEGAKGKKGLAKSSTFVSLPVIPSRKGGARDHDSWTRTCNSKTRSMCAELNKGTLYRSLRFICAWVYHSGITASSY